MSIQSGDVASLQFGYDVPVFNPELDPKYMCPICLLPMRDVMQTSCGHRFCYGCIMHVMRGQEFAKCPVDNTWFRTNSELFADKATRREILSLPVKCPNVTRDCPWTGELRDHESHGQVCEFALLYCEYGCKQLVQRCNLDDHHRVCEMRPVQCQHCKQCVLKAVLTRHQVLDCAKFPVQCSLCGQGEILREDIQHHLDAENGNCSHVVVTCPYKIHGCTFQDQRQKMPNHERDAAHGHLKLMDQKVLDLSTMVVNVNHQTQLLMGLWDTVGKEMEYLVRQTADCSHTNYNGRLHWKVMLSDGQRRYHSKSVYTDIPGYKLHFVLELNGHQDVGHSYTSLFVIMEKGRFDNDLLFPCKIECEATVRGQNGSGRDHTEKIVAVNVQRCHAEAGTISSQRGRLKFMRTSEIMSNTYTRDGCLYLCINVLR